MELYCLKTEDAQEMFRTPKTQQRKKILAKALNIPDFNEEDEFKTSILLDIYYENIAFAVEQGFPWSQVCVFFDLFIRLLSESSGKTLTESLTLLKQLANEKSHLFSEENLKSLIEFVFTTFFQHYKLYQYLLTQEQVSDNTMYHCVIEPPQSCLPVFQDGLPEKEWMEQQKLKEIEEKKQARQKEREDYYEKQRQKAQAEVMSHLELSNEPLSREELQKVVKATAAAQADVLGVTIRENLEQIQDSLEYKFLRASITQGQQNSGRQSSASAGTKEKKKK